MFKSLLSYVTNVPSINNLLNTIYSYKTKLPMILKNIDNVKIKLNDCITRLLKTLDLCIKNLTNFVTRSYRKHRAVGLGIKICALITTYTLVLHCFLTALFTYSFVEISWHIFYITLLTFYIDDEIRSRGRIQQYSDFTYSEDVQTFFTLIVFAFIYNNYLNFPLSELTTAQNKLTLGTFFKDSIEYFKSAISPNLVSEQDVKTLIQYVDTLLFEIGICQVYITRVIILVTEYVSLEQWVSPYSCIKDFVYVLYSSITFKNSLLFEYLENFKNFILIQYYIIEFNVFKSYNFESFNYKTNTSLTGYKQKIFGTYVCDSINDVLVDVNKRKYLNKVALNLNTNVHSGPNTHFYGSKSYVLLTLTIWQYWWWMSFIVVIILFNRITVSIFLNNTLRIEPKVHTSLKSNGRWGDLVASTFPVFWCANILVNSNYILRMTEKQTESGVFVTRIRGKQWYWVYKTSVNFKKHTNNVNLIIGRGNKLNATYGIYAAHSDNFTEPSTRWSNKLKPIVKSNVGLKKLNIDGYLQKSKTPHPLKMYDVDGILDIKGFFHKKYVNKSLNRFNISKPAKYDKHYSNSWNNKLVLLKTYKCHNNKLFVLMRKNANNYRPYNRFFYSIQQQPKKAWRGLKKNNIIYFNSETSFDLTNKQRSKLMKIKPIKSKTKRHFIKNLRMVSTYNTLILPTKVNITIITNSFDVVHSWFVPGLGVKFDCVPGRSTHYTLRIDKPGIYFGHCAEVCGRFHHHMPIKVIAVPIHHFRYYYGMYYHM